MSSQPLDYRSTEPATQGGGPPTCPSCGGADLVEGTLNGQVTPRFLPKQVRTFLRSFLALTPGVKTRVRACLHCGAVTATVNPDELRRLLSK